jgi:hypothetical protein
MRYLAGLAGLAVALAQESSSGPKPFEPKLPEHVRLHRIGIDPNVRAVEFSFEAPLCGTFPDGPKWVFTAGQPPRLQLPDFNKKKADEAEDTVH